LEPISKLFEERLGIRAWHDDGRIRDWVGEMGSRLVIHH